MNNMKRYSYPTGATNNTLDSYFGSTQWDQCRFAWSRNAHPCTEFLPYTVPTSLEGKSDNLAKKARQKTFLAMYLSQQRTSGQDLDQFIEALQTSIPMGYTIDRILEIAEGQVVIFTEQQQGKKFVLKIIDPQANIWEKHSLVRETVGSSIAEEMNLPINRVRILPAGVNFTLKPYQNLPATLHTFVDGESGLPVGIQQGNRGVSFYEIIQNMSKHSDLARIAALDTFLGNDDRHNWNILKLGDHYTGIDMSDIFQQPLATVALAQLKHLQQSGISLTPQEVAGLHIYCDTLRNLVQNYPVERVNEYLDQITQRSGLVRTGDLYTQLLVLKKIAKENIESSRLLLEECNKMPVKDAP